MSMGLRRSLLAAAALCSFSALAMADTASEESSAGEQVIVTGTRAPQRTVFESTTPVDVIGETTLSAAVSDELIDKLAEQVPSFNVRRLPLNDGLIYVRPATLRALSPDQTLVLINGKRQHRSAFLGAYGQEGVDMNQIASLAVGRIEVLRDGASAQYGSDAIAGVINVILDDKPGYSGYAAFSQYYEGDGTQYQAGAKAGYGFGGRGSVVVTGQWSNSDSTSRSVQRPDAIAYQTAHPDVKVDDPVQHWGQPDLKSWRFAVDAKYEVADKVELYAFGTVNKGWGMSDFNWRNPASTTAYAKSPKAYPNYDLYKLYPGGFTPRFGQKDNDESVFAGVRGGDKLTWDFSMSYGHNQIDYHMANSINASYGTDSPTAFYLGTLEQEEFNQNLDFVYPLTLAFLAKPVNIAFGAEHREEVYRIGAGEPMSWKAGPGAVDGLPSGANGFPGYSDDQAGSWSTRSYAGYVDVEAELLPNWTIGGAGRYESFSDFGSNLNGKVSTRWEPITGVALRGSYSTGFRAPTPGQVNSTRTSQGLDTKTLSLYTTGRLSPLNPVAMFFGAKPLQPEKSHSGSVGVALALFEGFTASVDAYQIDIADRFGLSANYNVTAAIKAQLLKLGVPGADSITQVNFFTNAYDSRTQGVDAVAAFTTPLGEGTLNLSTAGNFNFTHVKRTDGSFSQSTIVTMEKQMPNTSINASAEYVLGRYSVTGKMRFYGPWTDITGNASGDLYQRFGSIVFFDLSVGATLMDGVRLNLGAENLFNTYPDRSINQANRGLKYSRYASYDTDGGQYYLRLDVKL